MQPRDQHGAAPPAMLAINDALGFAPIGLEGLWQKKV